MSLDGDTSPTIISTCASVTSTTTTVTMVTSNSMVTPLSGPSDGNVYSSEIHKVSLKLPQFTPQSPEVWFVIAEAQFSLHRIVSETSRYTHLLTALPIELIQNNMDLIQNSQQSNTMYSDVKSELLRRLVPDEEQRIMELLYNTEMGDRKPSIFHRHLLHLVGKSNELGNKVIRKIFLDKLPKPLQRTLITIEKLPMSEQLSIADKLWEADNFPRTSCYSVSSQISSVKQVDKSNSPSSLELSSIKEELQEFKSLVKQLLSSFPEDSHNHRESSRNNNRKKFQSSRSKSRDKKDTQNAQNNDLCWYHAKFADKASKCIRPCRFFDSSNKPDSKKN